MNHRLPAQGFASKAYLSPRLALTGGGVERGESCEEAVVRELREEGGVVCECRPKLFAVYKSTHQGVDDYPVLYTVDRYVAEPRAACSEIAEVAWFSPRALPPAVTQATCTRIEEYLGLREVAALWHSREARHAR
jgi:8-oxo-dGTP pyrophosphatase MutT (NUDIX family)